MSRALAENNKYFKFLLFLFGYGNWIQSWLAISILLKKISSNYFKFVFVFKWFMTFVSILFIFLVSIFHSKTKFSLFTTHHDYWKVNMIPTFSVSVPRVSECKRNYSENLDFHFFQYIRCVQHVLICRAISHKQLVKSEEVCIKTFHMLTK